MISESICAPESGSGKAIEVDILLTVYNGMPYLKEQIRSLQAQTHSSWRLWVRDDGSGDDTLDTLREYAEQDPRVRICEGGGERLGAAGGFAWLLENAAPDAAYIMFCDADDSWLATKIESTLKAMREAEKSVAEDSANVPILVHTDLVVVDGELNRISDSFWRFEGISPQPAQLNRLLVHNSVTGCTVMINSALRRLAVPIPERAVMHDWWIALVAACFGRIVSVEAATLLYRQHGRNDTGARYYPRGLTDTIGRAISVATRQDRVRGALQRSTEQAAVLLERYGPEMTPAQRRLVSRYAGILECSPFRRKLRLIELGTLSHGWDRSLGLLLRA